MTRWLAIDTSTWTGEAALVASGPEGPRTVAEIRVEVNDSHGSRMLPAVAGLLERAGWSRDDVDAFVAIRGPGSFTGIRVGLGIVRGLALASGRPGFGVDALEAAAEAFGAADGDRIPILAAGRGDVYAARYDPRSSPPRPLDPPWVGQVERVARHAPPGSVAFGPGVRAFRERLLAIGIAIAEDRDVVGAAAAAARIAAARLTRGVPAGDGLSPLYLRPPDAVSAAL